MEAIKVIIELPAQAVLPVDQTRGASVRCLEGVLWITEEGNRNDYVVQSGEVFQLSGDGRAVIQALHPSRVAVDAVVAAAVDSSDRARRQPALRLQQEQA
ncbi:MAG: DUF2917 domain-containing protein [Betaproteobacteria bacterium]